MTPPVEGEGGQRHIASTSPATTTTNAAGGTVDKPPRMTAVAGAAPDEEVLLVACGKNHAVSVGSTVTTVPSPLVVCAGVAAGTEDVRVSTPHCTSLPEYVSVRDTSVGPVVLPLVNPEPKDEYSVHVAAVVEARSQEMTAVL